MSIHRSRFLAALLALAALPAFAAKPEAPPLETLPRWVVPQSYALDLRVDPAAADFSGTVAIDVQLLRASDHIFLHGKDLRVSAAAAIDAKGKRHAGTYVEVAPQAGVARIDFARTLKAGRLVLELAFSAPYNGELQGLYKVEHHGKPYVMTQMEPISARHAFPSFDEPGFKTPFDIRLTVPEADRAVANTAEVGVRPADKGWKTHQFARTVPLPTYLVAYAVGPWDIRPADPVPANRWRKAPLPLRGIATAGEARRMSWILGQTPAIVGVLEDYFAFGYPFDKLDLAAVPDFSAGAMENPGLVTFRDWLLLLDADSAQSYVQGSFTVTAHELAHMWTGDTVTMRWWNDLWLNEAFATWMQQKVTEKLHPEYRADLDRVSGAQGAMASDSLVSTRRIRQPITGNGDIQTAFDGITYQKGAAVLGMFESYVGEDAFREGMRAYIARHKFGNASAEDLIDAIKGAAGKGDDFKRAFKSFLDQAGVPMLETALECDDAGARIKLTQERYLPIGSSGSAERTWGVPLCVRTAAGTSCGLIDATEATLELDDATCPAWYMPNAGARGYYRYRMGEADLAALTGALDELTDAEKLAYADALDAAFRQGKADAHAVLAALPRLAASDTPQLALAPLETLGWIDAHLARDAAQKSRLRTLVAEAWLPRLTTLGYRRKAGESAAATEFRSRLAMSLGLMFKLPEVRAELAAQGKAVLAGKHGALDFGAADPDLVGAALAVAVHEGGAEALDALMKALPQTTDPAHRNAILAGLGGAPAALADRVRDFSIGKDVKLGEMGRLLFVDRDTPEGRTRMWNWFLAHHDAVIARTGSFAMGFLPMLAGGGGCSDTEAARLDAWFTPRLGDLPGADRGLAQATESIHLCAALEAAQDPRAILR